MADRLDPLPGEEVIEMRPTEDNQKNQPLTKPFFWNQPPPSEENAAVPDEKPARLTRFSKDSPTHLQETKRRKHRNYKPTPRQSQTLKKIEGNPGITRQELSETLGMNENTLRHHLGKLLKTGLVATWRPGNKNHYHLSHAPLDRANQLRILLQDERRAQVALALHSAADTTTVQAIMDHTGIEYKAVKRFMGMLAELGFVHLEAERSRRRIQVLPLLHETLYGHTDVPTDTDGLTLASAAKSRIYDQPTRRTCSPFTSSSTDCSRSQTGNDAQRSESGPGPP